jgi:Xaa-Pro aminopeptidase
MDYAKRRKALIERTGGAAVVLPTSPERVRSRDTHYRYRPDSDFLYLTGFPEPEAVLVLTPGHPEHETVLFVRPKDREREIWDGFRHGPEGAVEAFGVDAAFDIAELRDRLGGLIAGQERLFWPIGEDAAFDAQMFSTLRSLGATRRTPDRAPHLFGNVRPALHRMRMTKDAAELAVMERAGALAARAHVEAMAATRPGMMEYELEAIIEGTFRSGGASGPSYGTIVAGGPRACVLHYTENDQRLADGELVLVDAGCELGWYAADITRTWPVGERFSGPQRALYEVVLAAEIAAIDDARAGVTNRDLQAATVRRLTEGLVALGILSGDVDELVEARAHERFYMHGVGHYLGMDVHDVGVYLAAEDEGEPLTPGAVITIEPGLYVSPTESDVPEAFRGIGIRIEDDVVITDDTPRILTSGVPKTIDDIEALRRQQGGR